MPPILPATVRAPAIAMTSFREPGTASIGTASSIYPWTRKRRGRIGEQLSAFDALTDVLENLPQLCVLLPLEQQFERVQDWQPRPDQSEELLIEDQKSILLQLSPPAQR